MARNYDDPTVDTGIHVYDGNEIEVKITSTSVWVNIGPNATIFVNGSQVAQDLAEAFAEIASKLAQKGDAA